MIAAWIATAPEPMFSAKDVSRPGRPDVAPEDSAEQDAEEEAPKDLGFSSIHPTGFLTSSGAGFCSSCR